MAELIQPSFSKGELAPALHGRVDTQAYLTGLRTARNAVVHNAGGASNRAGLIFVAPATSMDADGRLIRFKFSDEDTYQLDFANYTMRVVRNDGHVLEPSKVVTNITQANPGVVTVAGHGWSNGDDVFIPDGGGMTELEGRWFTVASVTTDTFALVDKLTGENVNTAAYAAYSSGGNIAKVYTLATPYSLADLPYIKFTQSADVMTLAHRSHPVQELRRLDHDNWVMEPKQFGATTARPTQVASSAVTTGSVVAQYKVTAIDRETLSESLSGIVAPKNIVSISATDPVVVEVTAHSYAEGDIAYLFDLTNGMEQLNGRDFSIANVTTNTFELAGEDGTAHTPYVSGGKAATTHTAHGNSAVTRNNVITWEAVPGASRYAVYYQQNGLYGFLGETTTLTFTDNNITPDMTISPPQFRDIFHKPGEYPGAVGYFKQRLALGGSINRPDVEFYSRIADYGNFNSSVPVQDDDAITKALASAEVNKIEHFLPGEDNLVFTSSSEWRVNSGADAAFSPSSHNAKQQSEWGASHVRPLTVGDVSLFVQKGRRIVRSIGYSFSVDKYQTNQISLLAAHMFGQNSKIREWAFSTSPDPLVFLVKDDGDVACLTFDTEHEVVAWTRWDTDGEFRSVCVSQPSQTEEQEYPYFIVKRTVGGKTVRYIERLASRDFDDVQDAFFVDSGVTYDRPVAVAGLALGATTVVTALAHGLADGDLVDISDIEWASLFDSVDNETVPDQLRGRFLVANATADTFEVKTTKGAAVDSTAFSAYVAGGKVRKAVTEIGGLWHLEGATVAILADGNVVSGRTVSGGKVVLPRAASRVHVGLKYVCDLETLNIEAPTAHIQGRKKRFNQLTVRLEKTRGILTGPSASKLTEFKDRTSEKLGDPTLMLTGDAKVILRPEWDSRGRLLFRQRNPLPFTLLAVIPDLEVGD